MARIPEHELEQLKAELPIERLVAAAGVELRKQGKDLVGRCPFHEDRTPSLVISPGKNLWHCFGACQAGGSVIDWVMRCEGVSFRHAVELLRNGVAPAPVNGRAPQRSTVTRLPSPDGAAGDGELLGRVVDFYARTLPECPEALAYLERRRLLDGEAIETFRLGFANRTLGYRLPNKQRVAGAQLRGRLQRLGVLRESGHEHLTGSLVVPLFDEDGMTVQLYGRKIGERLRAGTPAHLYLPGPLRGVFNRPGLREGGGEVIVCESLLDALTFWVYGQRHVTAAFGVGGFSDEHLLALKAAGVGRVLVAYDRDDAGDQAAGKLARRLGGEGFECFRVVFPPGLDANELACSVADPAGALAEVLRAAVWLGAGPAPPRAQAPAGAASPVPAAPAEPAADELEGGELRLRVDERRWRVRGLERADGATALRVNVLVAVDDEAGELFHVDTLDLYSARARAAFCRAAAHALRVGEDVVGRDLGRLLLACERHVEQARDTAPAAGAHERVELSAAERQAALELLRSPDLVDRIAADFARAGVVGEQANCLVGYLAAVSRKLDRPLAVIVQSTSAAGKSALVDAVLAMVPDEERVSFSAMTGQSLFYMGEADLQHKVLAVAEEEGAERAAYALKLLQSDGELSIASTGKDPTSGRLVTHTYRVRGPVAILLTTTALDVDEELLNRCVVLSVDEERVQTQAIHAAQRARETLAGLLAEHERQAVLKLHRDAQRLLEPLHVVNPYAERLAFTDLRTRTRRDHVKYLTLIRAVALLHQHQRPRKTVQVAGRELVYIEATAADVALANRLAEQVLGRSLDELAPGTRRLLELIDAWLAGGGPGRFTRRELREHSGWGDTQLKVHLARLVSLELLAVARGERGAFRYEPCWQPGQPDAPGLLNLTDIDGYDADRSAPGSDRSGPGRGPVGGRSEPGRRALEAVA